MKYEEIKQDLFKTEKKYALGHCVAQDGGLGAGIATQLKEAGFQFLHLPHATANCGMIYGFKS